MTRPPFGTSVPGNRFDLLADREPDPWPKVSVIVVHYRQQRELDRTLAALARQAYPAYLLDVIVVDDGSPEPPSVPAGVTLIVQEDLGFRLSAARNLGVRASGGDVLCFLDADTAPEPDYVRLMTRLPALAPESVTVGTRRHADLRGTDVAAPIESAGPRHKLNAPAWLADAYRDSADLLHADDRSYRFMIGAVVACSRWFLDEIGGFDEGFASYGGEDWEWAQRAWLAGGILCHEPQAIAWHDGPDWAARDDSGQEAKNRETLALAELVPVAGSRPLSLHTRSADVVVHIGEGSVAASFLCVDSVLAALPEAHVVVPPSVVGTFAADQRVSDAFRGIARVRVDVHELVRVTDAAALRSAVAAVGVGDLGTVELVEKSGSPDGAVTRAPEGAESPAHAHAQAHSESHPPDGAESPGHAHGASHPPENRDSQARADDASRILVTVTSRRAALRAERWGRDDLFATTRTPAHGIEPIRGEPSLAAYLGGWG